MDDVEVVNIDLLPLSISLNHWLLGSHVRSLLKHLQALVTMLLLSSTSKHTLESSLSLDERCNFESEIISHLELGSEHIIPVLQASLHSLLVCRSKFLLLIEFSGVCISSHQINSKDPMSMGLVMTFL